MLQRPEDSDVGRAVNEAIADIEKYHPQLAGVLPHNYQIFNGTSTRVRFCSMTATCRAGRWAGRVERRPRSVWTFEMRHSANS